MPREGQSIRSDENIVGTKGGRRAANREARHVAKGDTVNVEIFSIFLDRLDDFSSILTEAADWLYSIGKGMWTAQQVSARGLLSEYTPDEMFLGSFDGIPVATMILQEVDALFWPSVPRGESLFLHKLSVRRAFAGTGLAVAMIDWAKREVNCRSKKFLRLDCAADREKLCEFYESLGFHKVREELMFGKWPTAFYEYVNP
jgi:GNAT superfamily N-acetyltransferase